MNTSNGLVARVIADALLERAEANHRGDTNAPTVTDIAKRVLASLGLDGLDCENVLISRKVLAAYVGLAVPLAGEEEKFHTAETEVYRAVASSATGEGQDAD